MNKLATIAALTLGASLYAPDASAFCLSYNNNVFLPASAAGKLTVVGRTSAGGGRSSAFIVDPNNAALCTEIIIQAAPVLSDCAKLWGTNSNETIAFISGTTSNYCGRTLTPVSFGGGILDVDGTGGNDTLLGGIGDTHVHGGGGNDALFASSYPGVDITGGSGNDLISAGNSTAYMYGHEGDDVLCASGTNDNASVTLMDGSTGFDRYCGRATTRRGLDLHDCNACRLF